MIRNTEAGAEAQRESKKDEWSEWDERHRSVRAGLAVGYEVAASELQRRRMKELIA